MTAKPANQAACNALYAASSALYFCGQPAFDDMLAEIAKCASKL